MGKAEMLVPGMLKEERIRFIVPEARRRAKCSKDTWQQVWTFKRSVIHR